MPIVTRLPVSNPRLLLPVPTYCALLRSACGVRAKALWEPSSPGECECRRKDDGDPVGGASSSGEGLAPAPQAHTQSHPSGPPQAKRSFRPGDCIPRGPGSFPASWPLPFPPWQHHKPPQHLLWRDTSLRGDGSTWRAGTDMARPTCKPSRGRAERGLPPTQLLLQ